MFESLACGVAFLIVLMVVNFGNDCVYFIFAYGGNGSFNFFRFGDSAEVFSSSWILLSAMNELTLSTPDSPTMFLLTILLTLFYF